MDIPAISAISVAAPTAAGQRTPAFAPLAQPVAANQRTGHDAARQTARPLPPANPNEAEAAAKRAQQREEKSERRESPADSAKAVGRIRFELEDGTRIAKFFDTKDVLIYQVPPEGRIYLVKSEEASSQDQVETSA